MDEKIKEIISKELSKLGGYGYYGFTVKEASLKGIKLLEYLRVENENLYNKCKRIPDDLKDWIEEFDLIWVIPMSKTYIERRNITRFLAFRELFQNALDAEHEAKGYDNMSVQLYVDRLGTHIVDHGKGLSWRAFTIGASEKPIWMRGHFGEGLNLAVLAFGVEGQQVYFFTKNVVYKTLYDREADSLIVVFGRSKIRVDGTHVLLYRYEIPEAFKKIYWKYDKKLTVFDTIELRNMPNHIFEDTDEQKRLFVRDIFVNYMREITEDSLFSYNLWWVELDPNRTMVRSIWTMKDEIAKLILKSPKAAREIIRRTIEERELSGRKYYVIDTDWLETSCDYYAGENLISDVVKEELDRYGVTCVDYSKDLRAVVPVSHEGGIVLIAPSNMKGFFKDMTDATDFIIKSVAETCGEFIELDEKSLSFLIRVIIGKFRILSDYIKMMVPKFEGVEIIPIKGRSHATPNAIYVDPERYRFETMSGIDVWVEEFAHAYGMQVFGSAAHSSQEFERALYDVAAYALKMASDRTAQYALRRLEQGAVNARYRDLVDTCRNLYHHSMFYKIRKEVITSLNEDVGIYIAVVQVSERGELASIIVEPVVRLGYLIGDYSPVIEEKYWRNVEYSVEKIVDDIKNYLKKTGAGYYFVEIPDILSKASKILKEADFVDVLVYDIDNDRYIRKKRINIKELK